MYRWIRMMKYRFIMTRTFNINYMKFPGTVIMFAVVTACNQNHEDSSSKMAEAKPDSVKAFVLKIDSAQKVISLPGELVPNENVQIRAKVQGYIKKVNVDIGSNVRRGQV